MTPWLDDGDVQLYHGDCLSVLAAMPAGSAQTCVTSPPFFNLRDYGVEGQLGLEATPEEYIEKMVEVFRGVWRVLRDDATLWLEVGDSYAANRPYQVSDSKHLAHDYAESNAMRVPAGLKPKDLIGIPWRLAFALQAAGWYLRSDIIWARPNPMPESVTDRPTKVHSYVFLLSKQPRYYWDADAIREPGQDWGPRDRTNAKHNTEGFRTAGQPPHRGLTNGDATAGRNVRSVWEIPTQPTPEAHFATYPEALVRRCILAGSSEAGECSACGTPWRRIVERGELVGKDRGGNYKGREAEADAGLVNRFASHNEYRPGMQYERIDRGWEASCACSAPTRPQAVLDPFMGSGTTALVARKHGRRAIGIDLNADYLQIAARRLGQQSLFAEMPA